jgi:thiamine biosynthesis protein ThiC
VDRRIVGTIQRIENLNAKARTDAVSCDAEIQAHIARFLCVLTSGLIEQILILSLDDMAKRHSHPRVAKYVSSHLSRVNNAKFEDIMVLLGRFDPDWRKYFEQSTEPEVKAAIDSIVNNRNQIAHGGQVSISIVRFDEYYRALKPFILELDQFISSH